MEKLHGWKDVLERPKKCQNYFGEDPLAQREADGQIARDEGQGEERLGVSRAVYEV